MNYKRFFFRLSSIILFLLLIMRFVSPNFFLFKKKPSLIKGLPSKISVAEKEFDTRVQKLFPPDTSDTEINRELSEQGFTIKINQEKKIASYKTDNFFCSSAWLITWQVGDEDNISDLRTKYNIACL